MSTTLLSQGAQDWTPDLFHWCWVQRKNQFPWPVGNALPNAAQEVVDFLFCKGTHSGLMFNFASHRTPRSFARTLPSSWLVGIILAHRIIPLVVQHFEFPFVLPYEIPANSLLQPLEVLMKGSTNKWCINYSFHFTTICKLSGYQAFKHDIPF